MNSPETAMRRDYVPTALALLLLGSQLTARAGAAELAPWSGAELQRRCLAYADAPESPDSRSCAAYIRGFLDGSTEVQVRAATTSGRLETFDERALRTRLGVRRAPEPLYCVDGTLPLSRFIAQVLTHLEEHPPRDDVGANTVLYGTLLRFHRCRA